MLTKVIQIGNSKGLRLSKTILERYDIGDTVNMRMEENFIVMSIPEQNEPGIPEQNEPGIPE